MNALELVRRTKNIKDADALELAELVAKGQAILDQLGASEVLTDNEIILLTWCKKVDEQNMRRTFERNLWRDKVVEVLGEKQAAVDLLERTKKELEKEREEREIDFYFRR
jgi:hypothetical protein